MKTKKVETINSNLDDQSTLPTKKEAKKAEKERKRRVKVVEKATKKLGKIEKELSEIRSLIAQAITD